MKTTILTLLTLFILPISVNAGGVTDVRDLPDIKVMDKCMGGVEFSEDFVEYQKRLDECYYK